MKRRYFSIFGVFGIALVIISGGYHYQSHNGIVNIHLAPLSLVSWLLFLIASLSIESRTVNSDGSVAPWWRKSVSFIYDFIWLFSLLLIPLALVSLYIHLGHFPPPWHIENSPTQSGIVEGIIFVLVFFAFWAGLGLCLSPKIQTPGMSLTNIDLSVGPEVSKLRLSIFGVFAYYGVFIPFFSIFSMGLKPQGVCRET